MSKDEWVDVYEFDGLEEGIPEGVFAEENYIVLFRIGDAVYATAGFCTHETADLCDGYVEGDVIECPLHQARFHIPTGKVLSAPADENLVVYSAENRGGRIFVRLST